MIERERFGDGAVPIWVRREHEARWEFAASRVRGVVLDCACGVGLGSERFARAGAARVLALDVAAGAARDAAGRAGVAAARGSGTALPLADRSVDVYVALETIEHVEDDRAFLREAARVLRPDGLFVCSTPNRRATNPGLPARGRPVNAHHVREYAREELEALLRSAFGEVELHGQNPVRARLGDALGALLPPPLPARLLQALKLPRLLLDRPEHHRVVPEAPGAVYEYAVALCRSPRAPEPR